MTTTFHAAPTTPVRRVFDNGVVLIVRRTMIHPAATVLATLPAGSGYDPDDRLGLASFVARVIDRGTERRSAAAISDALDSRGVSLSVGVTRHLLSAAFTCLSADVDPMLDLLGDVLMRPTFPADEVATRRAEIVTAIRQDEDTPAVVASNALMGLLYPGGHPYGRLGRGTVASVEAIERRDLAAFHRAHASPSGLTLVVVGDVDVDAVTSSVGRVFGDWQAPAAAPLVPPPLASPVARRTRVVPMPGKAQVDVAYGFAAIRRDDPAYYAMSVMNNVLGQYGLGGRLGERIREREGMAYYAYSSFDANVGEGPLVVRVGVSSANVERTIAAIDAEIDRMAATGVSDAELDDARRYLVGSLPRALETNAGVASFLQSAEFFGLGLDFDERLPGLIQGVTRDAVHEAARRVLDASRAAVAAAGPWHGPVPFPARS